MTEEKPHSESDLRTHFLKSALEILKDPNPDNKLTLRKVAKRIVRNERRMSRTAPYLVFGKQKDGGGVVALRLAVAAEGVRLLLREVSATQSPDKSPLSILHDWALAFFEFAIGNPRLFRLMELGTRVRQVRRRSFVHDLFGKHEQQAASGGERGLDYRRCSDSLVFM